MKGAIRKPRTSGGSWSYRIDLGFDDAGKRGQRQVGNFPTKREAQAAMNEALAGLQQGTDLAPSKQTVRDFLEVWTARWSSGMCCRTSAQPGSPTCRRWTRACGGANSPGCGGATSTLIEERRRLLSSARRPVRKRSRRRPRRAASGSCCSRTQRSACSAITSNGSRSSSSQPASRGQARATCSSTRRACRSCGSDSRRCSPRRLLVPTCRRPSCTTFGTRWRRVRSKPVCERHGGRQDQNSTPEEGRVDQPAVASFDRHRSGKARGRPNRHHDESVQNQRRRSRADVNVVINTTVGVLRAAAHDGRPLLEPWEFASGIGLCWALGGGRHGTWERRAVGDSTVVDPTGRLDARGGGRHRDQLQQTIRLLGVVVARPVRRRPTRVRCCDCGLRRYLSRRDAQ